MLLVDSSVWIEIFRKPAQLTLTSIGDVDDVVTALPIVQEVLQGFRDEGAYQVAREAMMAFPMVESPIPAERFLEAADLFRAARRAGVTVRSGVDCLIAACAIRHHLTVVHRDRDYTALARVSALRARAV